MNIVSLSGSTKTAGGSLLFADETIYKEEPWKICNDYLKFNGVLRYSKEYADLGWSNTARALKADWNAADQTPDRAVQKGIIDRFESLDLTEGGSSRRYSLMKQLNGNMNRIVFFCIVLLLLFPLQIVLGHEQKENELDQPYNIDTKPFLAAEHDDDRKHTYGCGGNFRAGYIQSSIGSNQTLSANALGGELGCGYTFDGFINAYVGLFASIDNGLNSSADSKIQADFFNRKKDGYILLGEASLTVNLMNFQAHLGRQRFDSPHMDGDDLRMIPNLFEAYFLDYHNSDHYHFGAGFIRQMAGWENGADQSHFIDIGDAFGGSGGTSWVGWGSYQNDYFNSAVWYYYIPDNMHIFYAEAKYSGHINHTFSFQLGLQYDWGTDVGAARAGQVQANTWGIFASLSAHNFTGSFAYNRNFSDKAALASLGGGPFFTSMEDQTLDAIQGEQASAIMVNLEYSPVDFVTFGSAFGKFHAKDKSQYDVEEVDLYLAVDWQKSITLEVMYANLDDKNTQESDHQFRAIFTYHF